MNSLSQSDNTRIQGVGMNNGGQGSNNDAVKPTNKKTFLLKQVKAEQEMKNFKNLPSLPNMPNVQVINHRPGMKLQYSKNDPASRIGQVVRISNSIKNLTDSMTQETTSQKSVKQAPEQYPMEIIDQYFPQVEGPQLQLSNSYISFIIETGAVAKDFITVKNNGTASIYYDWVRVNYSKQNSNSIVDPNEKFFCHHEKNVIKPGETRKFVFSFISKLTGIFTEEWTLQCEPPTITPLPTLKLTGEAVEHDNLVQWREDFDITTYQTHISQTCGEIVNDIIGVVRTPTPPLPDLENPEICRLEFERNNADRHLYYNPLHMKWFRKLEQDLYEELKIDPKTRWWDLNVEYLQKLIQQVDDIDNRTWYEWRLKELVDLSQQPPVERTILYPDFDKFVQDLCTDIPTIADNTRKQLDMWDYVFQVPKQENPTEAEIQLKNDEYTQMKAEWIKKTKQKKWGEEEDKKMVEEYRKQFGQKIYNTIGTFVDDVQINDGIKRLLRQISSHSKPTPTYFESVMRQKPLKDIELEGKRVLLRAHLKLAQGIPDVHERMIQFGEQLLKEKQEEQRRIEQEKANQEKLAKDKQKGKQAPAPTTGKGGKAEVVEAPPVVEKKTYDLSFLDQNNLNEIIETIKYILDHVGKLVILMMSYGEPTGQPHPLFSLRFFADYLKQKIDFQIQFNEECLIKDFDEKIQSDQFPENSLIILENCFFQPEEVRRRFDSQSDALIKYSIEEVEPYRARVSEYCPVIVIEDQFSIFKNFTSINNFDTEYKVMGLTMSNEVLTTGYAMWKESQNFVVFIGGNLTAEKIMAIDTFMNFAHQIHLTGTIAIQFMLVLRQQVGGPKLGPFAQVGLSDLQREAILKILERGDKNLIYIPSDYLLAQAATEYTQEWYDDAQTQLVRIEIPQDPAVPLPAVPQDHIIVDYGDQSIDNFLAILQQGHKVVWIDQVLEFDQQFPSNAIQFMARALFQQTQDKKTRQQQGKKIPGVIYDYSIDPILFIVGDKLAQNINSFPLVEQKPKPIASEGNLAEQGAEEGGQGREQNPGNEEETKEGNADKQINPEELKENQIIQPNNVKVIADFYVRDEVFALKLISGEHIQGLSSIHSYAQKAENNFDDEIIDLFHKAMEMQEAQGGQ